MIADGDSKTDDLGDKLEYSLKVTNPEKGTGEMPKTGARVRVHYTGKFSNGKVFDSSRKRRRPFEFILGVGQVIRCWEDAIATMKSGERADLTCPPELAYGEQGGGNIIPPNTALLFDLELKAVSQDGSPFEESEDGDGSGATDGEK